MVESLELTVRLSNGTRLNVVVGEVSTTECTVKQVKEKLIDECPVDRQRLIYKGRILEDDRTLQDYGIVSKSTLFLVKGGGTSSSGAAQSTASSTPSTTASSSRSSASPPTSTPAPPTPPGGSAPPTMNPMNPWGMPPAGFGMPNPGMGGQGMEEMLNSPMMQTLLDNPQTLQNMMNMQMQTNPALRQMMENNPQLRQMMSDPNVLQQAMQMMRNPGAMQQAMRNQDLAMSNIENMPGGFAALSNMYRDIQQPLEESMMPNSEPTAASQDRPQLEAGATGSAMPNPWGSPSTSTPNSAASGNPSSGGAASNMGNLFGGMPAMGNPFAGMPPMGPGAGNPWAAMRAPPGQPPSDEQMEMAINMLDNPLIQQMMEQTLNDNPDMIRQMLQAQNPMMAQMFAGNPEAANNYIRTMMNPNMMRSMLQMQRAFGGVGAPAGGPMTGPPNPWMLPQSSQAPTPNSAAGGALDFSALLEQMSNTGLSGMVAPTSPQNPADRYRSQLRSLYDMGFDDEQQCLAVLKTVNGNLNRAVDILLTGDAPTTNNSPAAETNAEQETQPKPSEDKKHD